MKSNAKKLKLINKHALIKRIDLLIIITTSNHKKVK